MASTSASAAPVSGVASVTILKPVTAHEDTPLAFGNIDATASAVVLTVNPDGTTRCSVIGSCRGRASPAIFTLTGSASERVGVAVTDHATLTSPSGDSIQVSLSLASPQIDLIAGRANIAVGGEIAIPVGQSPGQYRGEFHVDVNYQ